MQRLSPAVRELYKKKQRKTSIYKYFEEGSGLLFHFHDQCENSNDQLLLFCSMWGQRLIISQRSEVGDLGGL